MARKNNMEKAKRPVTRKQFKKHKRSFIIRLVTLIVLLLAVVLVRRSRVLNDPLYGLVQAADANKDNKVETTVVESDAMKDYTNLVLFGVDSTQGEIKKNTRTDTMIIASINNKTGDMKLVSVYRDTFLNIGGDRYTKCNAAYANGGPKQAIEMLNSNLDLNITDFVTIGFGGLAVIIDDIGGITLNIAEDEIFHLNNYQTTMAEELGMQKVDITTPGEQVVNGLQAVAYCRIRYTAGNDFRRTERQREVLTKAIAGIRGANPMQMMKVGNDLMKWSYMSLDAKDMTGLLTKVMKLNIAETAGFPAADMIATGVVGKEGDCVIPVTLSGNVTRLHETLFGETGYTPSATVEAYSAEVRNRTGK